MANRICAVDGCPKDRGTNRDFCSMHAQRIRVTGEPGPAEPKIVRTGSPLCRSAGCEKPKKKGGGLCSMHRARLSRTGRLERVIAAPRPRYVASNGYVRIHDPQHDMSDTTGYVYEHRAVLYADLGAGAQQCAWCRCEIHWRPDDGQRRLEVDHFNADRQDNDAVNLLPSCHSCNTARIDQYEFHKDGTPRKKA